MTPAQQTALASELKTDPLARGYAAFIPACPGVLVDMINAQNYTAPKTINVTARAVLAAYGATGAAILDKLEAVSASVSAVKWAMKFMLSDGIDVNHPNTRGLLAQLVVAGAITQADADALTLMALQPSSRADVLSLGGVVTQSDVKTALGL